MLENREELLKYLVTQEGIITALSLPPGGSLGGILLLLFTTCKKKFEMLIITLKLIYEVNLHLGPSLRYDFDARAMWSKIKIYFDIIRLLKIHL